MSKKKADAVSPEWTYLVEAERVSRGPFKITIAPTAAEKSRLVRRLAVLAVDELEADLEFEREAGARAVHVKGRIRADIRQNCVVTREPVSNHIDEGFDAWFADEAESLSFAKARHERQSRKNQAEMPMLDERADPESIVNGQIDAGELVAQHLSLFIDPYPQAEGAEYKGGEEGAQAVSAPEEFKNPFAALKDWKTKLE